MLLDSSTKKQRLWIISELYYPETASTRYCLTKIAEGLADELDVKAICGARKCLEVHHGVEIHKAFGTHFDKNVAICKLVNMFTFGVGVFVKALNRFRRGDKILVVTTPLTIPFVAACAALFKGCGYTLLIHDSYPKVPIAKKGSVPALVTAIANRWLFKHASKVIVGGMDLKELMSRKTEGLEIPIDVIPDWTELEKAIELYKRSLA